MTDFPSFAQFFRGLHGNDPFPWQERLAARICEAAPSAARCGWPGVLDLPTGAGKTAAIDVALYCLAREPKRMPRRTVLVVDRRVVVDQGAERARRILARMADPSETAVAAVADKLRKLWGGGDDDPPFHVAVMRGGMPRDNDWARRPDQPVVGLSTVDQVGSRLLFRGYGVSRRSRSIHAGLIGNDTLILLDEVHLAQPFAETLGRITGPLRGGRHAPAVSLPSRFAVVQMSATVAKQDGEPPFGLTAPDHANPVLSARLTARKPAAIHLVKVTGADEAARLQVPAQRAADEAKQLVAAGAHTVAIVVNRVECARLAAAALPLENELDVLLLTGRMRPIERDHFVQMHRDRIAAGRHPRNAGRPLIVVATQCIEAGADFDFDGVVTECASLDALRQRFGRVDRLGQLGASRSVILMRHDQTGADDPVYGKALAATWDWLQSLAHGGEVDFGIAALAARLTEAAMTELVAPKPEAPALLPAHLDAWAQTSHEIGADPDVALWLHGPQRASADVQLVWRSGLRPRGTARLDAEAVGDELALCRPSTLEMITVPIGAARRWLRQLEAGELVDLEGVDSDDGGGRRGGRPPVTAGAWLRWSVRGGEPTLDDPSLDDLEPGDTIIIDASFAVDGDALIGGLHRASFDPSHRGTVVDLGDLAQLRARGVATLRLDPDALAVWGLPEALLDVPWPVEDEDADERAQRVTAWLARWPEAPPSGFVGTRDEWAALLKGLRSRPRITQVNGKLVATAPVVAKRRAGGGLPWQPEVTDSITEDDDSSFTAEEATLEGHSQRVETVARAFGQALGFTGDLIEDLALAGWLHDVGKADPRFQRMLVGGSGARPVPLAKSSLPSGNAKQRRQAAERSGYPRGARHEVMSLALIEPHDAVLAGAHDRDLVLHLVASHHGWCRPFPPMIEDPNELTVTLRHGDYLLEAPAAHALARLDSGVASRFWRLTERYGWWGLAWLEAVLRLADHRVSEGGDA